MTTTLLAPHGIAVRNTGFLLTRLQHALTISVHRDPVVSIQDSHVPTMFGICVKCNLINCLLELELISTHGWRHHSMLECCDKHFICGRKEKKIQDAHQSKC